MGAKLKRIPVFGRLRPYLGKDKSKLLLNAVVLSNFSYCPLIWLICSKTTNNEIGIHRSALRILSGDYELKFYEILNRDNTKITHAKNLQIFLIEVYKWINYLNPEYMWEFFVKKDV